MRIIGKLIVVTVGFLVGILLTYEMLRIISFESSWFVYSMLLVFLSYLIGWLLSIFLTKQRLLLLSMFVFFGYFIYLLAPRGLLFVFTQLTLTMGFMGVLIIGIFLSRKPKARNEG